MTKFKVAHILHSVGGVDVSLRLILENIDAAEFENIVIHGKNDTNVNYQDQHFRIIKDYKLPISREISFVNDLISIAKTYSIIRKEKPDLIHAHSAKGGIIGRFVGILTGTKVVFTPQAFSFLSATGKTKRNLFLLIEKMFSKGNSVLLASSPSEAARGIEEVGFDQKKVQLFNNAIAPITEIVPLSIAKTWPNNYICTVGRPCFQKNIDEMIRVLYEVKKHNGIHLVLMGVGHHSDQLDMVENLIAELDLKSNVTLLEWTSRTDVLHIISHSQLYISTARYEGLPYSIIESLALGIPCVVSNCDGNRDLIEDGFNGYIINDNNTMAFSKKIMELLSDKKKYQEFSDNSKKIFQEHYNIQKTISELESIYIKNKN